MKKPIYVLALIMLVFTFSCSSEDDTPTTPEQEQEGSGEQGSTDDNTLISKIVVKEADGTVDYTVDYTYDGNKLIKVVESDGVTTDFKYEDNLLTEINQNIANNGETIILDTFLTYDSEGNLTSYKDVYKQGGGQDGTTYVTYGDDGKVSFNDESNSDINYYLIIKNNNLNIANFIDDEEYYEYSFDDKNNPFKNIFSLKDLMLLSYDMETSLIGISTNNVTQIKDVYDGETTIETIEYTYNDANYPTKATWKEDGEITETYEYTYK